MKYIKFRAWDEDGHMFFPTKIEFNKTKDGDTWVWEGETFGQLGSAVISLMQDTGCKDKNGKDIYEGDILKIGKDGLFLVKWNGYYCAFKLWDIRYGDLDDFDDHASEFFDMALGNTDSEFCKIVGNQYENPELIEEIIEEMEDE